MSEKKIVKVRFGQPDSLEFKGREYTYFTTVDLIVGDVIIVPSAQGELVAKVTQTGLTMGDIDYRIMHLMKTITEIKRPKEQKCRVCGCTQNRACPGGCYWVEPDLCSACTDHEQPERSD